MFYLSTELTGCLVGPRISRDAHKLAWISRVIKKHKKKTLINNNNNNKSFKGVE
jgi:hypothetical protein